MVLGLWEVVLEPTLVVVDGGVEELVDVVGVERVVGVLGVVTVVEDLSKLAPV